MIAILKTVSCWILLLFHCSKHFISLIFLIPHNGAVIILLLLTGYNYPLWIMFSFSLNVGALVLFYFGFSE